MWPWRDWVVDALNRNMPFDQFTVGSSPATCCPTRRAEQKLATGFCRNHMINGEGGRIAEENRVDYVMDMAETVGHRLARPDLQLLPLPRPQVRPDLASATTTASSPSSTRRRSTAAAATPRPRPCSSLATPEQVASRAQLDASLTDGRQATSTRSSRTSSLATGGQPASDFAQGRGPQARDRRAARSSPAGRRSRGQIDATGEALGGRRARLRGAPEGTASRPSTPATRLRAIDPAGDGHGGHAEAARDVHPDPRARTRSRPRRSTAAVPAACLRCRPTPRGTGSGWPAGWSRRRTRSRPA